MQINFKAKKLQEANKYVDLLNASSTKRKTKVKNENSLIKRILNFLFR